MGREPVERRVSLRVQGDRVQGDDVGLALFEWPGTAPTTLFVHATGFHARCWDGVIRALPAPHALAVDLRAHGRSERQPPYDWETFGNDLLALVRELDLRDLVAVGHSMGGYCVAYAAALEPERFRSLVLVDPVIFDPEILKQRQAQDGHPRAASVRRRKNDFASPEAMFERFRTREPYSRWREDVLRDYCVHGLLPAPEGEGYTLACPPDVEASIYEMSSSQVIGGLLPRIQAPVTVLRARERDASEAFPSFDASPTWRELAAQLPKGRDVYLPEQSHFLPMEAPELVARYVSEARGG
jgi:pimeloyl-ACP methyl ester carboxylesterase